MKLHAAIAGVSAALALVLTGCVRESVDTTVLGPIETVRQEGVHYVPVPPSPELIAADGKVTVVEFFWYGSPQCYTFDPHLVLWNRHKPENVEFKRVPTAWGQYDRPHARLFYTLEALGRNDLHAVIFDTFHGRGQRLETAEEQLKFATSHGIDEREFLDAYNSAAVKGHLKAAEQWVLHYQVDKLPTLIVNGKYKTDLTRTDRNAEALLQLIGDLSAHEAAAD